MTRQIERESIINEAVRRARLQSGGFVIGGGESNTGANVGTGAEVFKDKSGVSLRFRSITGAGGITVTENANEIEIDGSGVSGGGGTVLVPVASAGALVFDSTGDVVLTPYVP